MEISGHRELENVEEFLYLSSLDTLSLKNETNYLSRVCILSMLKHPLFCMFIYLKLRNAHSNLCIVYFVSNNRSLTVIFFLYFSKLFIFSNVFENNFKKKTCVIDNFTTRTFTPILQSRNTIMNSMKINITWKQMANV